MSQYINYWKWFPAHNSFPFTPIIMKLHIQTPHEARMCPIDIEVKRSKVKIVPAGGMSPVRTDPDLVKNGLEVKCLKECVLALISELCF